MDDKKLLFIYNPRAGKGQIRNNLLDIIDTFVKAGYIVTARPTQYAGEAVELAADRTAKYDLVVCSGGDGTLDEVVTGIMKSVRRRPIGYIPAGSTNDFAQSLNIPKNMAEAAKSQSAAECLPAMSVPLTKKPLFILRPSDFLQRCPMKPVRMSKMCWGIWRICWRA